MNFKLLTLSIVTIVIGGCSSNPISTGLASSNNSPNNGIKRLDIQEIADAGLYSKSNDDAGLYNINFYKASDSAMSWDTAFDNVRGTIKEYCGNKSRSSFLGNRVKPIPMLLKPYGNFGFFKDDVSYIFICKDAQFNSNNQDLYSILSSMEKDGNDQYSNLVLNYKQKEKEIQDGVNNFADGLSKGMKSYAESLERQTERQHEINKANQMRIINTNCTKFGNNMNCVSY
jgi:hypothetical protein